MPGSVPLDRDSVTTEITQYLEDNFRSVLTQDVAGEESTPFAIDKESELYGKRRTTQRLARSVFMGATPTPHTAHKGVDKPRIFLGTAIPATFRATSIPRSITRQPRHLPVHRCRPPLV